METEQIIRELDNVYKEHINDKLFTFQLDISGMALSCKNKIIELQEQIEDLSNKNNELELKLLSSRINPDIDNKEFWLKVKSLENTPFEIPEWIIDYVKKLENK